MTVDFGQIIAHVCASTGWTWDYVAEHIDLPRLESLNAYWADHPPMHLMVAAYLGIKPEPEALSPEKQDFSALMSLGDFTRGSVFP